MEKNQRWTDLYNRRYDCTVNLFELGQQLNRCCPIGDGKINPKTGIVEKHTYKMADFQRYCALQRGMDRLGWTADFGLRWDL